MNRYVIRALFTLIVFFCVFTVQASLPKPLWQSGKLILWDKTILDGDISYNWLMETIMLREPDGRIRTFSAGQVVQFGWFDYSNHKYRDFKALATSTNKQQDKQSFFEVCMDGPLSVVRRLKPPRGLRKYVFIHPVHFMDQPSLAQNVDFFDYFVYDAGHLRSLDRFHTDIYRPLMTAYSQQLKGYVTEHNLNERTTWGQLILIDRYNRLVEHDAKIASIRVVEPASK